MDVTPSTSVIQALLNGSVSNLANLVTAIGALGGASMGLVDTTKMFRGGPSNFGFGFIEDGLAPFLDAIASNAAPFGKHAILRTLKGDWLNGAAKPDQKAKAKSLIQLSLSPANAAALANVAAVDAGALLSAAQKKADGGAAAAENTGALAQFESVLTAVIDEAYERGDQKYRNAAKTLAMGTSVVLSEIAGMSIWGHSQENLIFFLVTGLIATPLAPIAKDVASALQTAATTAGVLKK
ncbi:hypothetical protein L6654_12645 [Bradyrhizobium sp. WYCCWR 13023]|uniref:Uncharacterized protein n=1 Tax=Bradyrhizobium zhengyangense TaxID=2911009 RepID=A0A9X1R9K3_9BRAD|nr:hypothetical protein [Bradyrhizobium zhengyangense]MCG2627477.1 hypothetical protein [Bradyrhizobium zhengyangense]MCG2641308.1 hypothetical protein [Bradyrhizobium zhengyangense]MCG2668922.1 hypothetical protein [Bradyrhizobium zhengyangense]